MPIGRIGPDAERPLRAAGDYREKGDCLGSIKRCMKQNGGLTAFSASVWPAPSGWYFSQGAFCVYARLALGADSQSFLMDFAKGDVGHFNHLFARLPFGEVDDSDIA